MLVRVSASCPKVVHSNATTDEETPPSNKISSSQFPHGCGGDDGGTARRDSSCHLIDCAFLLFVPLPSISVGRRAQRVRSFKINYITPLANVQFVALQWESVSGDLMAPRATAATAAASKSYRRRRRSVAEIEIRLCAAKIAVHRQIMVTPPISTH